MPIPDRGTIVSFMRAVLKENFERWASPQNLAQLPYVSYLLDPTLKKLHEAGLAEDQSYSGLHNKPSLAIALMGAYQYLISMGYLVSKPNVQSGDTEHSWFGITESGKVWINSGDPMPEDHTKYMAVLDQTSNLDAIVRQFVLESLRTYNSQLFFASAVMLGAASEKIAYLLADSVIVAVQDTQEKNRLINLVNNERSIPKLFSALTKHIERAKQAGMPYSVHQGTDTHLLSLQESIRVQRNDAVHPATGQVSPESIYIALSAFPAATRKVYDLKTWFDANRI
jgi:hypothetical protein